MSEDIKNNNGNNGSGKGKDKNKDKKDKKNNNGNNGNNGRGWGSNGGNPGNGRGRGRKSKPASSVMSEAKDCQNTSTLYLRDGARLFHDNEGDLLLYSDAIDLIQEEIGINTFNAQSVLSGLISDHVDPVIQINTADGRYVGIIEYVEGDGWYGYIEHDDVHGRRNTVVCAQCVHDNTYDTDVVYAREGEGSFETGDYSYEELAEAIYDHYDREHDGVKPENVETGASLISGTTISGNTAWHAGNDGSGSGLNADLIGGRRIYVQPTEPSNASENDIWIDNS